jgi:hypothetical protein
MKSAKVLSVKEKMIVIFLTVVLCSTSIVFPDNKNVVSASGGGGESNFILSSDTIHRVTENLLKSGVTFENFFALRDAHENSNDAKKYIASKMDDSPQLSTLGDWGGCITVGQWIPGYLLFIVLYYLMLFLSRGYLRGY